MSHSLADLEIFPRHFCRHKILTNACSNAWHVTAVNVAQKQLARTSLTWLKQVSTLERDVLIRRIDTTTLYHLTATLGYHIKHQLWLKKIWSFLRRKKLPWQQESPAETPHFFTLAAYISKTNSVTLIFLYFWNVISMQNETFCKVKKNSVERI